MIVFTHCFFVVVFFVFFLYTNCVSVDHLATHNIVAAIILSEYVRNWNS